MKKISIILLYTIIALSFNFNALAQESDSIVYNEEIINSLSLLNSVGVETESSNYDAPLSRIEFLRLLSHLLNVDTNSAYPAHGFSDIEAESAMGNALNYAVSEGIISKSSLFRPTDSITGAEAIKMCVSALGNEQVAAAYGGWFTGYLVCADSDEILDGVDYGINEALSLGNAIVLLANTAQAPLNVLTSIGDDITYSKNDDVNIITYYHNCIEFEGIVSSDEIVNIYSPNEEFLADEGRVIIGDKKYKKGNVVLTVGMNIFGYAKEDTDEIIFAKPIDNKVIKIPYSDIKKVDLESIEYYLGNSEKNVRFDTVKTVIYNGKLYTSYDDGILNIQSGYIELIDNNGNGKYDVAYVWESEEMKLISVDGINEILYFDNSPSFKIEKNNLVVKSGNKISDISALTADMFVECYFSKNRDYLCIIPCTNVVKGLAESINTYEKSLTIDDKMYIYGDYFERNYVSSISYSIPLNYIISSSGVVVAVSKIASVSSPGYLIDIKCTDNMSKKFQAKMFTEKNEIIILDFADKIKVDSEVIKAENITSDSSLFENAMCIAQLVLYQLDEDNKINLIDTADFKDGSSINEYDYYNPATGDNSDCLQRFKYNGWNTNATVDHRKEGFITPYFTTSSAVIFKVNPNEGVADKDKYEIINYSGLGDSVQYEARNIHAYNVTGNGNASYVLLYSSSASASSINEWSTGVAVKSVTRCIIPDSEEYGWAIYSGSGGSVYYIPDDNISVLDSMYNDNPDDELPVSFGDYLRIATNKNEITFATKDFDYSSKTVLKTSDNPNTNIAFYYGKVYSTNGKFTLADSNDIEAIGAHPTLYCKMFVTPNAYSTLNFFDTEKETVTKRPRSEVIAFENTKDDTCDYMLIRCSYGQVMDAAVYR